MYASGNSSYQILRFPNAPAAMMLMHSLPGFCSDLYVFKCVRTVNVSYGVQCAAVLPIGVLFRLQIGLENRLEHQYRCCLHNPIPDCRYS